MVGILHKKIPMEICYMSQKNDTLFSTVRFFGSPENCSLSIVLCLVKRSTRDSVITNDRTQTYQICHHKIVTKKTITRRKQ